MDPVRSLTFIPFAVAFDDLLERVAEHKRLFDISLRTGKHDDLQAFIGRVIKALLERDEYMQDDIIRRNLQKDREIHNRKTSLHGRKYSLISYDVAGLFQENVRKWIQSPDYKPDFEKARDARSSSTGDWLQAEASYVTWKAELHGSVLESGKHEKTTNRNCRPILWLEGVLTGNHQLIHTLTLSFRRTSWLWEDRAIYCHHRRSQKICNKTFRIVRGTSTKRSSLLLLQRSATRKTELFRCLSRYSHANSRSATGGSWDG